MKKKLLGLFLALFIVQLTYAQRSITGIVSDEMGGLIGVTVLEKGTENGTTTAVDGRYNIKVADENAVLVFEYIGFDTQEMQVGQRTTIDVNLSSENVELDEIVVTALGFVEDRKSLGITYSKIDAEAARRSGETGTINALAGKASGVKIARANGDPGAGSSIQIRGANTITGNSQPLIVVDGIPFSNENANGLGNPATAGVSQQSRLNDINPDDIETINILKGASAAAVWGSLASNGVIVITTKKGRNKDKIDVTYSTSISVDQISEKHPLQSNFGQGTGGVWRQNNSRSWGDKIADRAGGADELDTTGEYFEAEDGTLHYPIDTKNSKETFVDKNFDQVFRTGLAWNNSLSLSGANDKGNFYFSLGHLDNKGIVENSYYDKINASLNVGYDFTDWLSIKSKLNYININSNRIQQSSNTSGLYLGLLRNAPDVDNEDYIGTYHDEDGEQESPLRHRSYRNIYGSKTNPVYSNPAWVTNEQENLNNINRYVVNLESTLKPTRWLTLIARGGVDNYIDFRTAFFPVFSTSSRVTGEYWEETRDLKNFTFDLIGRTKADLTEKIHSSYSFGYGHNNKSRYSNYTEATSFILNSRLRDFETLTTDEFIKSTNSKSFFKSDRVFAVASFDYDYQLFLNLSGAYQTFSSASVGVFYPAMDVSWNFSELSFLENSVLSYGKLRTSIGQVGVAPQRHRFNTTFEVFSYNDYDDPLDITYFGGGFRSNDDKGNANLKPEIKTEFEIGADLKFLNDRLGFNITYYNNVVNGVLFDVPVSPSWGFNNEYRNAGKLKNIGIEFDWNLGLLEKDDYSLSLYGNFNHNKNEVLELEGTNSVSLVGGSISSTATIGHPVGALFGTKALRNDDGSYNLDENGFPQLDPEQGIIGDPNPDWRGGLGLRATFKNIYFNILFETSQGNDYAERTRFILRNFGTHTDVGNEVMLTEDLVNVEGDVFTAGSTVRGNIEDFGAGPVLLDESWYTSRGGGFGSSVINEFAVADGSWTRLREVTLGYTLKGKKFREKTKLGAIDFTLTGRNLKLWTGLVGVDPDINQSGVANGFGIDYFTNPTTRSFVFSLKITY